MILCFYVVLTDLWQLWDMKVWKITPGPNARVPANISGYLVAYSPALAQCFAMKNDAILGDCLGDAPPNLNRPVVAWNFVPI